MFLLLNSPGASSDQNAQRIARKTESTHSRKAVKIFLAITGLYIFSFTPVFLNFARLVDDFTINYIYFLNHIGNPIIYFIVDDTFRTHVVEILRCRDITNA